MFNFQKVTYLIWKGGHNIVSEWKITNKQKKQGGKEEEKLHLPLKAALAIL